MDQNDLPVYMRRPTQRLIPAPRRPWRRIVRSWFWITMRFDDGWSDVTEHLELPAEVLDRFSREHTEIDAAQLPLLNAAFWQWTRICGRRSASVVQPSVAVESAWRIYRADVHAWANLPVHVQRLPYCAVRGPGPLIDDEDPLHETHIQAHFDELISGLPVLFRIDEELGVRGGRLYTTKCTNACGGVGWHQAPTGPTRIRLHETPFAVMESPSS